MITLSSAALAVVQSSYQLELAVDVWLRDVLLAASVPVVEANEDSDRSLRVPERVTLTLPRRDRGTDYGGAGSPIQANGQRLRVSLGVGKGGAATEWFTRGWFLIDSVDIDSDTIKVEAVGLLKLIDEAQLLAPFAPTGTIGGAIRSLIEPALTVTFDASLVDRAVPAGITYSDGRLDNVGDLLDAWPAECRVTDSGIVNVFPVVTPVAGLLTLTNGVGGTVIEVSSKTSRDGAYNVVVARGTAADGGQVQGVAYDTTGPRAYGSAFNPLPVPFFYQSPLITTVAQAQTAANTRLATLKRSNGVKLDVTCVPHPALQVGDPINVVTNGVTYLCTVESLGLPYTPSGSGQSKLIVQIVQ